METVRDLDSYVKSMSSTMPDKCWFVPRVQDVDTVVDFGCAQGDLAIYLDTQYPGQFKHYVGVDNSPEMIAIARRNHFITLGVGHSAFFQSFDDAVKEIDPGQSVLVLNSVLHEVFTYMPDENRVPFLRRMFDAGFKYIAIRDMYSFDYTDGEKHDEVFFRLLRAIRRSKYAAYFPYRGSMSIQEFLLKYRYTDNWAKESEEQYLWPWMKYFEHHNLDEKYVRLCEQNFFIPYIREHILQDFGVDYPFHTHKRVLYRLREDA